MRFRQQQLPPEASEPIRQAIREALETESYFIYPSGKDYLIQNGFDEEEIVQNLITYIDKGCRIYKMIGEDKAGKYECVLKYTDINVYAKLANKSKDETEAWFIALDFHNHNTGHPPLPD